MFHFILIKTSFSVSYKVMDMADLLHRMAYVYMLQNPYVDKSPLLADFAH